MTIRLLLAAFLAIALSHAARADDPTPAERIQLAKDRTASVNNLKRIGLAAHEFESAYGHFPNNGADAKGKLTLSWRVLILPYLNEEALFKEFKLDESWESEHNKKLVAKMPKVYVPVRGQAGKGETFYRGFTGPSTMFEAGKKIQIRDILDGTSNTVMAVEAEKPVPWTKPDDLPFDPKKDDLPKVGGAMFEAGFNAVICDGSVRYLKKELPGATLRALITRDGGEVVVFDK